MSDSSLQTSWFLKAFVALGVLVAGMSMVVGWRLRTMRETELSRFQACEQGVRSDCEPSLFWVLAGLVKVDTEGRPQVAFSDTGEAKKQVIRTGDSAPFLTSLRPEGLIPEGQGYRVVKGTDVKLRATVEGAKRVEARLKLAGSDESVLLGEMKAVKDQPDTYELSLKWNETRLGELEIRAYGTSETERVQLLLPLRVE